MTAVETVGALTGRNLLAHLPDQTLTGTDYVGYLLAASTEELIQGIAVIAFVYAVGSHLHRLRDAAVVPPADRSGGIATVTALPPRPQPGM